MDGEWRRGGLVRLDGGRRRWEVGCWSEERGLRKDENGDVQERNEGK